MLVNMLQMNMKSVALFHNCRVFMCMEALLCIACREVQVTIFVFLIILVISLQTIGCIFKLQQISVVSVTRVIKVTNS